MSFEVICWISFTLIFVAGPLALLVLCERSDRAAAWAAREARRLRRDLAAWLLAKDGMTAVPARMDDGALLEIFGEGGGRNGRE